MKDYGMMKPKKGNKMAKGLDKPAKAKEDYKDDAHPMSPVCKAAEPSVWDKRAK